MILVRTNHPFLRERTSQSLRLSRAHSGATFQKPRIVSQLSRGTINSFNFGEQSTKRHDDRAVMDMCIMESSIFLEHIINPIHQRIRITRRSMLAAGRSESREDQC
jgi:hypothetical protein